MLYTHPFDQTARRDMHEESFDMIATTVDRVPRHTSTDVNRHIEEETADRIRYYAATPAGIGPRLRELDEEWDTVAILSKMSVSIIALFIARFDILSARIARALRAERRFWRRFATAPVHFCLFGETVKETAPYEGAESAVRPLGARL